MPNVVGKCAQCCGVVTGDTTVYYSIQAKHTANMYSTCTVPGRSVSISPSSSAIMTAYFSTAF